MRSGQNAECKNAKDLATDLNRNRQVSLGSELEKGLSIDGESFICQLFNVGKAEDLTGTHRLQSTRDHRGPHGSYRHGIDSRSRPRVGDPHLGIPADLRELHPVGREELAECGERFQQRIVDLFGDQPCKPR